MPYVSFGDATAARDLVVRRLDEQAAGNDAIYQALVGLRGEVQRAVPGIRTFPQLATITQSDPTPSVVLAYQLYGSVEQETDIIARNRIRHPGLVSGELEVLAPTD